MSNTSHLPHHGCIAMVSIKLKYIESGLSICGKMKKMEFTCVSSLATLQLSVKCGILFVIHVIFFMPALCVLVAYL
jgi:hypothetical protein